MSDSQENSDDDTRILPKIGPTSLIKPLGNHTVIIDRRVGPSISSPSSSTSQFKEFQNKMSTGACPGIRASLGTSPDPPPPKKSSSSKYNI
jgi:hypothetical protein